MAMPTIRSLTDSDRNMLHLLLSKYYRRGFEVYVMEIEGGAYASTMGYQIRFNSGPTSYRDEFRFQKFSGGLLKARWMVVHKRWDDVSEDCVLEQYAWVTGLANALAEAESLIGGKRTPYSTHRELAEAIAAGWA